MQVIDMSQYMKKYRCFKKSNIFVYSYSALLIKLACRPSAYASNLVVISFLRLYIYTSLSLYIYVEVFKEIWEFESKTSENCFAKKKWQVEISEYVYRYVFRFFHVDMWILLS